MDRSLEARQWRRGFFAGIAALALSVGGQLATSAASSEAATCPYAARPSVAQQVFQRIAPRVSHTVAHRVALALLGAMFSDSCS